MSTAFTSLSNKTPPINIVVIISGSGTNLQAIIDQIACGELNARIAAVISNKKDAYGLTRAEANNLSTEIIDHKAFDSRESFDEMLASIIDLYSPDLIVLAGFMRILTPAFVNRYHGKMLNVHPSLLPKYKGVNTHQRVLDANEAEHGSSIHFVTEELDGGPVVLQATLDVAETKNVDELTQRVQNMEYIVYPAVINWFAEGRLKLIDNKVLFDDEPLATPIIYREQQDAV